MIIFFFLSILQLQSSQWLEDLKEKWWTNPDYDCGDSSTNLGSGFDGIGFDNIGGFFLTLIIGIILAFIILIMEYYWLKPKIGLNQFTVLETRQTSN